MPLKFGDVEMPCSNIQMPLKFGERSLKVGIACEFFFDGFLGGSPPKG
jgi:hypothetical protein